jgi:hypothetical protein
MREETRREKGRIRGKKARNKAVLTLFFLISSFFFSSVILAQTADNLNSAVAAAEEARKIAGYFEGASYFPGEWEAAESQYEKAKNIKNDTDNAVSAYNQAAAAFGRVFELAIPLYAQAREDEIMAVRSYLITLGARDSFQEYLRDADRTALLALTQYEEKDYYSARDSAAVALRKFSVLETAFNAWLLRVEIWERGFTGYDTDNFELGGELVSAATDAYMEGDLAGAQEKAEKAQSAYNLALANAWAEYAHLRSSLAEGERLAALDTKTNIASNEFFKIADAENKTALELLEAGNYESAARLFIDAEAMFVISSITTLEKRRTADAALRNADEKIRGNEKITNNESLIESRRLLKLAEKAFSEGDYDASARFAGVAASLAAPQDEMAEQPSPVEQSSSAEQSSEKLPEGVVASKSETMSVPLPAAYTVQPWTVSKDCFWNIAGLPWVYGDPRQWRLLYNANKTKLPNPDNPDILEPGTVLDIPSIKGELRQGAWDSAKTYEPLR